MLTEEEKKTTVSVRYGTKETFVNCLDKMTVEKVIKTAEKILGAMPKGSSKVVVEGKEVGRGQTLKPGQTVEIIKKVPPHA